MALILRWRYIDGSSRWKAKCEECWIGFQNNRQSRHSLKCWKIGIPFSAFKDHEKAIEKLIDIVNSNEDWDLKYMADPGLLKLFTGGVAIVYTPSKESMVRFIKLASKELRDLLKEPRMIEDLFYRIAVNTDKVAGKFYYRRGCPEYDWKFGDWRKWRIID